MIDLPLEPEENSAQQTANSTGPPRNRQDQVTKRSKAYMAKVLSLAAFLSQTRIRKYIYIYISVNASSMLQTPLNSCLKFFSLN